MSEQRVAIRSRPGNPRAEAAIPAWRSFGQVRHHRVPPDYDLLHVVTVSVPGLGPYEPWVAAGGGFSLGRAQGAAIGEALERLALRSFDPARALDAPYVAGDDFIDPRSLLHYPPQLFQGCSALRPYRPGERLFWVEGRRMIDGKRLWVPTFAVFAPGWPQASTGGFFDAVVSTGAACHRELRTACLQGLYEVVERDAFTIHWESRQAAMARSLPGSLLDLSARLRSRGFELQVGQLSSDTGVPVALAALVDQTGKRAALAFGAAARRSWEQAAFRAAEEALLTSFWVSDMHKRQPASLESVLEEMEGLPAPARHAYLYGFPEMRPRAAFLWNSAALCASAEGTGGETGPDEGPAAELAWLLRCVRQSGAEPVLVDLTTPEAAHAGCIVVRVLVPGFVPLGRGRHARPLANPRLAAGSHGPGRPLPEFNPDPHPFP